MSKSKKFKLNENFQPLPMGAEDELFRNGIFEFNVTKLLAFIKANPHLFVPEQLEVKTLRAIPRSNLNESTIQTANPSVPILLAEISPGRFNVIDGNHRLERAYRDGVETLPAFRIFAEQHLAFLTSEKAYKIYVDYWNSKIDDMND